MHSNSLESLMKQGKNDELMKTIVRQSNSSDLIGNYGVTLLHLAAKYNNAKIIKFLSQSKCNVDARNSSESTPLIVAARSHSFDAVKVLLDANASVFARDAADNTILDVLWSERTIVPPEVFECLVRAMKRSSCDVDATADIFVKAGCTLEFVLSLHEARVTEAVLKRTTAIEPTHSQSALEFAMRTLDLENLRVLLHEGPATDARTTLFFDKLIGMTQASDVDLNSFETFVRAIVNWDIVSQDKLDYLHQIFINGSQQCVRVLLQCEVDVRVKRQFGVDLLAAVFGNRRVDVIELLKNRKFDVNAQGIRRLSALHFALRSQSVKNVQYLVDVGADLNVRDEMGKTPLLDSHAWDGPCLAQLLLQHGADIQLLDNAGVGVHDLASARIIRTVVIPHLAILNAQEMTISHKFQLLINLNTFVDTYRNCCRQVESFKKYVLTESVTIFHVFTKTIEALAARLRDEDLTDVVRNYCLLNRIIPYYSSTLQKKLKRSMTVHRSKCNMALIVSANTGYPVGYDHYVIEKIFSFLTFRDVCSLV